MDSFLIIAIDFGTAFAGYSFYFNVNTGSQPQIRVPRWGQNIGTETLKTPTCILFDENGKFLKFGYDAMMSYTRQSSKNVAKKQYLFSNFKMELYNKEIHRDMTITAKNGKTMSAMKVFSESISFLKDHALKSVEKHTRGKKFIASDVTWVLTVPAIWSGGAKQFMREAAVQAGLVTEFASEQLIVALEPEAASLWCKEHPADDLTAEGQDTLEQKPGTQYMVVDCGGGTVDITVHEMLNDGYVKELHKASGNDMGGQTVDKHFQAFLREIFSDDVFDEFEREYPGELQKMMYEFSFVKCLDDEIVVPCHNSLPELAKKKQDLASYFKGVYGAEWDDGSIYISQEKFRSFFDASLQSIAGKIREILRNPKLCINQLVLVGGYASSPILRNFICKHFSAEYKVTCPSDAQTAVMKGAIEFGKNPKIVRSRISVLTYGIGVSEVFDPSVHQPNKIRVNELGVAYSDGCFHKLVEKGESVDCDEIRQITFYPTKSSQTEMHFPFYSTEKQNAKYIDEWGLEYIGLISVPMTNISKGTNRTVRLEIKFGFTEILATARDEDSNKTESIKMDFLSK
ncbi:heat shock 70 kDa protein 12A-like [Chanos chanos]|uniref:Heat shock 70 kDa protein 12A-like n=1 Tax=Chanos chanos TaxID=29144 RepID=A0A6J2USE1_CHACN|nr:heat shock 70 kDa protein 12A-like [Chanos chanos]